MSTLYFYVNAVLYVAFALICTLRPNPTATSIGFTELNKSGHSEYLVIYGGLQLGLALFYFILARDVSAQRIGLIFSLLLYAPIVVYRIATLLMYRPTSPLTLGTAALEIALLIWAFILWRNWRA